MFSTIKLQSSNPAPSSPPLTINQIKFINLKNHRLVTFRSDKLPIFSSLSIQSDGNVSPSVLTSSIGSVPQQWSLTKRHITVLNIAACLAAVSTSWLMLSAIPALLAFKRAAESIEELMDVMREELPDTMAAVRLSGMEISDLTMELSDLGQEITRGVRNSTQAVRVAEDRLRRLTNMVPNGASQSEDPESGTSDS